MNNTTTNIGFQALMEKFNQLVERERKQKTPKRHHGKLSDKQATWRRRGDLAPELKTDKKKLLSYLDDEVAKEVKEALELLSSQQETVPREVREKHIHFQMAMTTAQKLWKRALAAPVKLDEAWPALNGLRCAFFNVEKSATALKRAKEEERTKQGENLSRAVKTVDKALNNIPASSGSYKTWREIPEPELLQMNTEKFLEWADRRPVMSLGRILEKTVVGQPSRRAKSKKKRKTTAPAPDYSEIKIRAMRDFSADKLDEDQFITIAQLAKRLGKNPTKNVNLRFASGTIGVAEYRWLMAAIKNRSHQTHA